jgi:ribosome-binding protein aMBF1 (putative translation factor)
LWYNNRVSADSLEVRPDKTNYNGHGGRRARAGRPPELKAQIAEAKSLAKQLQGAVRSGLLQLAENYDSLIELAIQQAALGDTKVLLRLLELPAKMGFTLHDSEDDTPPSMQIEAAFRIKVNEAAEAVSTANTVEEDITEGDVVVID